MAVLTDRKGRRFVVDDADVPLLAGKTWAVWHGKDKDYVRATVTDGAGKKAYVYLHDFLMNPPSGMTPDHANGDGLDNRRQNLRLATASQQAANRGKRRTPASSRFKGVSWSKRDRRWQAHVACRGIRRNLGTFRDEREAAMAYDAAARELFGEFARTNF